MCCICPGNSNSRWPNLPRFNTVMTIKMKINDLGINLMRARAHKAQEVEWPFESEYSSWRYSNSLENTRDECFRKIIDENSFWLSRRLYMFYLNLFLYSLNISSTSLASNVCTALVYNRTVLITLRIPQSIDPGIIRSSCKWSGLILVSHFVYFGVINHKIQFKTRMSF